MSILFSVAVCTRDRPALLARLLEGLCAQTLDPSRYEVIVVDNGSADAAPSVVEKFARRVSNVRCVREERVGLSHARNRGWAEAAGEYVAYTDDDCTVPPGWLETARGIVEEIAPPVFGGPYHPAYDSPPPAWYRDRYASSARDAPAGPLGPEEFLSGGNIFFRRSLLRGAGGFRADLGMSGRKIAYAEEVELQRRLRAADPALSIRYDPALFVHHLVRPEKMSVPWIMRQRFAAGVSAQRALGPAPGPRDGAARLAARAARDLARFGAGLVRAVVARDRARYPDWRNFLFEEAVVHLRMLGGTLEMLRQRLRPGPRERGSS